MDFITIDCGASFVKAALFNSDGEIVGKAVKQSPFGKNQIGTLTPLVRDICDELLQKAGDKVCLSISNEMHGFILADEKGTPITDYISWQKEYGRMSIDGGTACEMLSSPEYSADILHTGMPLRGGLPSVNLFYLKKIGKLNDIESPIYFYTLGDYLTRILADTQPICHLTNAAATGLVDLKTNTWNERLLNTVASAQIVFPEIGTTATEFVRGRKKVTLLPAIGDQQAALYGANLSQRDELSFNMGTGGQVSRITVTLNFSPNYQLRPFFNGNYIKTIPHLPCGRALNVYIRFFRDVLKTFDVEKDDTGIWKNILDAETKSNNTGIKCDLSFFENAACKNLTGSVTDISEYSLTAGSLMKAVFNQLADNFVTASKKLSDDNWSIRKILFSGGVARKIKAIREKIIAAYGVKDFEVAADETLTGLFRYGAKGIKS